MKHDIDGMRALVEKLKEEAFQMIQAGYQRAANAKIMQYEAIEKEITELLSASKKEHGGARPGAGRKKRRSNLSVPIQFKISEIDEDELRAQMREGESLNTAARRIFLTGLNGQKPL